jgi:hypothetical protein
MNRRPVPDVRASAFCVTPSPLRVSRTSLPMSCDVYFIPFVPFIKVTVREYFSSLGAKVNAMLPYGNISYHKPSRRLKCSRAGTQNVPRFGAFLPNNKEAGGFELSYRPRIDLTLKMAMACSSQANCLALGLKFVQLVKQRESYLAGHLVPSKLHRYGVFKHKMSRHLNRRLKPK